MQCSQMDSGQWRINRLSERERESIGKVSIFIIQVSVQKTALPKTFFWNSAAFLIFFMLNGHFYKE